MRLGGVVRGLLELDPERRLSAAALLDALSPQVTHVLRATCHVCVTSVLLRVG